MSDAIKATADLSACQCTWSLPPWCSVNQDMERGPWTNFLWSRSVRARKALQCLRVESFARASTLTTQEIRSVYNTGATTAREIKRALEEVGIFIR